MTVEEYLKELTRDVPAGRYGEPEELANVIVFLGSEKSSYVTGASISVDGGLSKALF
jgi:3-oxoacyl-[acyl-carrier protein] reductase